MDKTIKLGPNQFSLQATIEHHEHSIYSGHDTTAVLCFSIDVVLTLSNTIQMPAL